MKLFRKGKRLIKVKGIERGVYEYGNSTIRLSVLEIEASGYQFYQGQLVIAFDEYEVAPGYMGTSEFVVDEAALAGIFR